MQFTKVEGCGNHFILLDQTDHKTHRDPLSIQQIRRLCDPYFGIGADGILCVRRYIDQTNAQHLARYEMIVYNADGSLAEMCGNGLRCVVRYLHHHYDVFSMPDMSTSILTGAGLLTVSIDHQDRIGVKMGWPQTMTPRIFPEVELPMDALSFYSLGNPHLVSFEPHYFDERRIIASEWSHSIQGGINVSFAQLRSADCVEVHVFERGCGWTLGCGTGACATVYHGYREGLFQIDSAVTVKLPGGSLTIDICDDGLTMWGAAREVYRGVYLDL